MAYTEKAGALYLSLIETKETRMLAPASGDISPLSWFPDGTEILATKAFENSLWRISVLTGRLTKMRDNVGFGAVSPNGKWIIFIDPHGHEYWIMASDGQNPKRIMVTDSADQFLDFAWAPSSERFAFMTLRRRPNAKLELRIETQDIEGKHPSTLVYSNGELPLDLTRDTGLCWLPDGRLVYSLAEAPPNQSDFNLWTVRVDASTGKVRGEGQRLTDWTGFSAGGLSASADGKRLEFTKTHAQNNIYVSSLALRDQSGRPKVQQLTSDTWSKEVDGWTSDSQSVYLSSNRSGRYAIYRQSIRQRSLESVIAGPEDYYGATLTSDGGSILYTATASRGSSAPTRLMSVAVGGGPASVIATGDGEYEYQCATAPTNSCILSKKREAATAFYTLDPKRGPAPKPFASVEKVGSWSLSPDAKKIALIKGSEQDDKGRIQILDLAEGPIQRLEIDNWTQLQFVTWSRDASVLYVTAFQPSMSLLSVNLHAQVSVLFQQGHNWICCPIAAPNGRLLAFAVTEIHRDAAMIENF